MIKCFLSKIGKKNTLQKKLKTPYDIPKSQEVAVNEVMETISLTQDNHTDRAEPLHKQQMKRIY